MNNSTSTFNSLWSSVQSKLPKNIFNFTIRYINNTLPTRKNLQKWGISPTSECSFCLNPESLLLVVAGCKTYLNEGRFTWRHDSVLNFIASILKWLLLKSDTAIQRYRDTGTGTWNRNLEPYIIYANLSILHHRGYT